MRQLSFSAVVRSSLLAASFGVGLLLVGCGGGGGGSTTSATTSTPAVTPSSPTTAANVVAVSIRQLENNTTTLTANTPYVNVTICDASNNCQTIPDVMIDTGSAGLRLFANKVSIGLPAIPAGSGNLAACAQFASGYAWGGMRAATVKMGGEITTSAIPIQLMNDPSLPAVPPSCQAQGTDFAKSFAGIANGILGVSNFRQDCGSACTTSTRPGMYYACSGSTCTATTATLPQQGTNPIIAFPVDNNGSTLTLPEVPLPNGAGSAGGTLTFGIGTQSNNALAGSAQIFPVDRSGNFQVVVNGQSGSGFIDSGSNGIYLDLPGVTECSSAAGFYCPSSPVNLTVQTQGYLGTPTGTQTVMIGNAEAMFQTGNTALPALGGTAAIVNFADLGLPFFYGRPIATGIDGTNASAPYGYWAY